MHKDYMISILLSLTSKYFWSNEDTRTKRDAWLMAWERLIVVAAKFIYLFVLICCYILIFVCVVAGA